MYSWIFWVSLLLFPTPQANQAPPDDKLNVKVSSADTLFRDVYNRFQGNLADLSFPVFATAFRGYLNLQEAGLLAPQATLSIVDFSFKSSLKRLWVLDLQTAKVLYHTYVAHGKGSGEDMATRFSNIPESHQSSLGFYVSGEPYIGKHGKSLKLKGVDTAFNHMAEQRAIVLHGAPYVSEQFIATQGRLGRSFGCPAVSDAIAPELIDRIQSGHCLFLYSPHEGYLSRSVWLQKTPDLAYLQTAFSQTRMFTGKEPKI